MRPRLVLITAVLSCAASVEGNSTFCINANDGTNICSSTKIPNGEALTKFIESIMTVNVNRTGMLRMTPNKFEAPIPPPKGPLRPNRKLENNSERKFNFLTGPESLAKVDNFLYAAATNAIYKIDLRSGDFKIVYDGNAGCSKKEPCSRPLGIRVRGNRLLCADSIRGLIEVNLKTGNTKVHLSSGTTINGAPVLFPNDIDIDWDKQIVYLTHVSTKWNSNYGQLALIESDASSRIIRFDLKTGRAKVFAQNISFANGVQLSHDKKFLLVDEYAARRVLKYQLDQTLPAAGKPFTGLLPGNPDNIRPSLNGGYWVALYLGRSNGKRNLVDELQARPDLTEKLGDSLLTFGGLLESTGTLISNDPLRDFGKEVGTGRIILRAISSTMLLELDARGNTLQSLQSTQIGGLTQATEHEGGLYCGGYSNKFILSVPRANFRSS